jgi:hypothetical protein
MADDRPGSRILDIVRLMAIVACSLFVMLFMKLILLAPGQWRPSYVRGFKTLLLLGLGHVLALLIVWKAARGSSRIAILFWGLSTVLFVAAGGWGSVLLLLELALFAVVCIGIGDGISSFVLEEEVCGWAAALSFGIAFISCVGTLLAATHLFAAGAAAAALAACLVLSLSWRGKPFLFRMRKAGSTLLAGTWSVATTFCLEGLFLLGIFSWVWAGLPEKTIDGMRVYLPYVNLLEHFHGFVDLPSHRSYIIPQPGLTYAGLVQILFGAHAARYAMSLALLGLVGMICARGKRDVSAALAVALVVATCPLMLRATFSLMQEAFVSLVTFLLALACIEGRDPGSWRFWAGVGALAGLAWVAKYTTIVYAGPLLAWAAWRSVKARGLRRTVEALPVAGAGALATAGLWLWHAYRQSGNPLFPYLAHLFPSPLWPEGLGKHSLGKFRFGTGAFVWLTWPFEATFHTDRISSCTPGHLGLVVPLLTLLTIPLLFARRFRAYVPWILAACLGTALLWTQTAYARYWFPAFWLLAVAAVAAADWLAGEARGRLVTVGIAACIFAEQVAFTLLVLDFPGLPWSFYTHRIDERTYSEELFRGYAALRELERIDPGWPRVWFTDSPPVGFVNVVPLEAILSEFHQHGLRDDEPAGIARFLNSTQCDYWIVSWWHYSAREFQALGIGKLFWRDEYLVAADEFVRIYRMPYSRRAREAVGAYRARPLGIFEDLLKNGGFEQTEGGLPAAWGSVGGPREIESSSSAIEGKVFSRIGPGESLFQSVEVPPGARRLVLTEWARSAPPDHPSAFRLQLNWIDASGKGSAVTARMHHSSPVWELYQMPTSVPGGAVRVVVYLTNGDRTSTTDFDAVHLYAAKE